MIFQASDRFSGGWRGLENRENVTLAGSLQSAGLSRSRSMDFLPQRENSGTRALCELFESKAKLQQKSSGSSSSARNGKTGGARPLQDRSSNNISAQVRQFCVFVRDRLGCN